MTNPLVKGVEHVSIAVRDAETAKRTYSALGFSEQWVEELTSQGLRSHVLRAGDVVVELIESTVGNGEVTTVDRFLDRRGEGVHHLCLRVDSVEEAVRVVESSGMHLVDSVAQVDDQGRRVFVRPEGTHGVLLGLVELHRKSDPKATSTERKVIELPGPEFTGKTFVPAVAHAGIPLFVSGLTAVGPDGEVEGGDVVTQARVIFAKLTQILVKAGATPAQVVKTTDYILSRDQYRDVAVVRREFFGQDFPAATGVVVRELLGKGVVIEMDAVVMV
jgi:methylmalonyl-CoA epimerase